MIVVIVSILYSCTMANDTFYTKILNDFTDNSYYIKVPCKIGEVKSECLVENDDFYSFINQSRNLDKDGYKKFVLDLLKQNKVLEISGSDYVKHDFIEVKKDPSIDADVKKGKDFFLNKYFKNRVIIDDVTDEKRNYIIKVLYDWQIASKIDDETGYLVVSK